MRKSRTKINDIFGNRIRVGDVLYPHGIKEDYSNTIIKIGGGRITGRLEDSDRPVRTVTWSAWYWRDRCVWAKLRENNA